MNLRFINFVALRYFRARRKSKSAASTLFSVLGLAVGVMTLTAVLAVMNGFQLGFVESILEVSSYHIQIQPGENALHPDQLKAVAALEDVRSIIPFTEYQTIAMPSLSLAYGGGMGRAYANQRGCLVRGIPADVEELDSGFIEHLDMVNGFFLLDLPNSILLGSELARHLGVAAGDKVSLVSLTGSSFNLLKPLELDFVVTGLFKTGYYEFDLGWAFVSLQTAASNFESSSEAVPTYGIKIQNRFRDQVALKRIGAVLEGEGFRLGSWREFNSAFFNALLIEKLLMMGIIGLIFIVVGFNIYHTLRRTVWERYEDIGVLKALGATGAGIQYIFVLDGLLIGLFGGTLGLALGLGIAANINEVFAFVENLFNGLLSLIDGLAYPLLGARGERFSLFSPAYFYISEVPIRVLVHEAFLINLFALFSTVTAAAIASLKVTEVKPAKILRYE